MHIVDWGSGSHTPLRFAHCPYCWYRCQSLRSAAVPGAHSFGTGKGEEELEGLRNRFAAALHYYGLVHKTACLPVFCQWGDTMWPHRKVLSARRMALDKWHPHSDSVVLLENRQTLPDVGTAAFYHFNLTMDVFRFLKSMFPVF